MIKNILVSYKITNLDRQILKLVLQKARFEIFLQRKLNKCVKSHLIQKFKKLIITLNYKKENE